MKDENGMTVTPVQPIVMRRDCLRLMTILEYEPFAWLDPFDEDEMNAAIYLEKQGMIKKGLSGKAVWFELAE